MEDAPGNENQVPRRGRCIRVYPGQYFDFETNFHYNWYRFYDPSTGRYIRKDPIGMNAGINYYLYAL
ncbi:MAG: hypothetical protein GY865_04165 [candidate division Zixibacteria bacterium]|nr:hypothetical protein [candidate division Zixibacteria bacterium]